MKPPVPPRAPRTDKPHPPTNADRRRGARPHGSVASRESAKEAGVGTENETASRTTDSGHVPDAQTSPAANRANAIAPRILAPNQVSQRRRERRRAKRALALRTAMWWGMGIVALVALVWVVGFSSLLSVREDSLQVSVRSGEDLDTDFARSRLLREVGTPLLRVDTGAVADSLMENPQVADATVSRLWPGGLSAELTPRVAVIAVETKDGYQCVAEDGVAVFTTETTPDGLPVVKAGDAGSATGTQIEEVLTVWADLPIELRQEIASISLQGTTLGFTLMNGASVIWGDESQTEFKSQVLQLLLSEREAQTYDVSTPNRPSTR